MHHIQNSILTELMTHKIRRFSELKPQGVDSNLFQYHLGKLIRDGYLTKLENGYTLSGTGLYYADRFSSTLKGARPQPKLIVVNVLHDKQGRVLLIPKTRQPFLGTYHLPAGKVHEGEKLVDAGHRELLEKTAIQDVSLTYTTLAHITIRHGATMISEYYAAVMHGVCDTILPADNWYTHDTLPVIGPGVAELLSIPHNTTEPFYEWELSIEPSDE